MEIGNNDLDALKGHNGVDAGLTFHTNQRKKKRQKTKKNET